jgi:hypothetical protein
LDRAVCGRIEGAKHGDVPFGIVPFGILAALYPGDRLYSEATMEIAIQKLAAICFFIVGLSHVVQARAWAEFFILLRAKGAPGNFVNAFFTLHMGALIVSFHNVWTGIPAALTVLGWLYLTKSLVSFVYPPLALRSLAAVSVETSWKFAATGAFMVAFSGLLAYSLL